MLSEIRIALLTRMFAQRLGFRENADQNSGIGFVARLRDVGFPTEVLVVDP